MIHIVASLALALALAGSPATLVSAAPAQRGETITVPVSKGTSGNPVTANDVVDRDLGRIAVYNGKPAQSHSGKAINKDVTYVVRVSFCSQAFDLIVDTGSSNTWAGAHTPVSSSCGTSTGQTFSVKYGSGQVSGTEKIGPVSYAGLAAHKQSFGAASSASGFDTVDGIIGFGPVGLTQGTVSGTGLVPTFMDNLYSQRSIPKKVLGVYFAPEHGSDTDDANGELTLGGVDPRKYTGPLHYFSLTAVSPFSRYWGIDIKSVEYGSKQLISRTHAIVDTGTTLIYIPTPAYNEFLLLTGGTTSDASGFASFTKKPTHTFTINIGSASFPLTPSQYLVPPAQYSHFGLTSGFYYAWINDGGADSVNFLIGQKFLENYYSVYDTAESRIGLARRALF